MRYVRDTGHKNSLHVQRVVESETNPKAGYWEYLDVFMLARGHVVPMIPVRLHDTTQPNLNGDHRHQLLQLICVVDAYVHEICSNSEAHCLLLAFKKEKITVTSLRLEATPPFPWQYRLYKNDHRTLAHNHKQFYCESFREIRALLSEIEKKLSYSSEKALQRANLHVVEPAYETNPRALDTDLTGLRPRGLSDRLEESSKLNRDYYSEDEHLEDFIANSDDDEGDEGDRCSW